MSFWSRVQSRAKELDSYLCVGLDPHGAVDAGAAEAECVELIDSTAGYACCYKPNMAFFEVHGGAGLESLVRVIAKCQSVGAPVLLDAKRGDVGSTAKEYARCCFETLGTDGVTLSPYLGWDSCSPFAAYEGKGLCILCATSNPSAKTLQSEDVRDAVARLTADDGEWGKAAAEKKVGPLGLVVGATDIEALTRVRLVNEDAWILAPGVGAQGGDLERAVRAGRRPKDSEDPRLIIPVSRGISKAENPAKAACDFRDAINAALRSTTTEEVTSSLTSSTSTKISASQMKFIEVALQAGALKFGQFTLKSGRLSPYFFNAGLFCGGASVGALFDAYAEAIAAQRDLAFDVIFGPAYKGIPLCAGVAAALARKVPERFADVAYAYNRKEAKDHGEGGTLVGADVAQKNVLLIDDVISAGTAIRESSAILTLNKANLVAAVVALDRQEVTGDKSLPDPDKPRISAVDAAAKDLQCPVFSIIGLQGLLDYLETTNKQNEYLDAVRKYRDDYGVTHNN